MTDLETAEPTFPHIHVRLIGEDGSTGAILARVCRALRSGGASAEEVSEFRNKVMFECPSYDHVLRLVMETVNVYDPEDDE